MSKQRSSEWSLVDGSTIEELKPIYESQYMVAHEEPHCDGACGEKKPHLHGFSCYQSCEGCGAICHKSCPAYGRNQDAPR